MQSEYLKNILNILINEFILINVNVTIQSDYLSSVQACRKGYDAFKHRLDFAVIFF